MSQRGSWEPALSASRAKEYLRCPLQYRLHVIDGIVDPPTRATAMGTMVHSALERLFTLPAEDRVPEAGIELVHQAWTQTVEASPDVLELFPESADHQQCPQEIEDLIRGYFNVEFPQRLQPDRFEALTEAITSGGVRLRGFIDRVDRAPNGELRVIDYKTGKAPSPRFVEDALYQMRFYALLLKLTERLPQRLQLLYVRAGKILTLDPAPEHIDAFEQQVETLWQSIENDALRGEFSPKPNPLCNWCSVKNLCPQFGGETPPIPNEGRLKLLRTRVSQDTMTTQE